MKLSELKQWIIDKAAAVSEKLTSQRCRRIWKKILAELPKGELTEENLLEFILAMRSLDRELAVSEANNAAMIASFEQFKRSLQQALWDLQGGQQDFAEAVLQRPTLRSRFFAQNKEMTRRHEAWLQIQKELFACLIRLGHNFSRVNALYLRICQTDEFNSNLIKQLLLALVESSDYRVLHEFQPVFDKVKTLASSLCANENDRVWWSLNSDIYLMLLKKYLQQPVQINRVYQALEFQVKLRAFVLLSHEGLQKFQMVSQGDLIDVIASLETIQKDESFSAIQVELEEMILRIQSIDFTKDPQQQYRDILWQFRESVLREFKRFFDAPFPESRLVKKKLDYEQLDADLATLFKPFNQLVVYFKNLNQEQEGFATFYSVLYDLVVTFLNGRESVLTPVDELLKLAHELTAMQDRQSNFSINVKFEAGQLKGQGMLPRILASSLLNPEEKSTLKDALQPPRCRFLPTRDRSKAFIHRPRAANPEKEDDKSETKTSDTGSTASDSPRSEEDALSISPCSSPPKLV